MNYNKLNVHERWIVDNYLGAQFKIFNVAFTQENLNTIDTIYQYILNFVTANNGRSPRDKAELDAFIYQSQLARHPIRQPQFNIMAPQGIQQPQFNIMAPGGAFAQPRVQQQAPPRVAQPIPVAPSRGVAREIIIPSDLTENEVDRQMLEAVMRESTRTAQPQAARATSQQALEQLNRFDNAVYNPVQPPAAPAQVARAPVVAPVVAQNDPWKNVPQSQAEYDNFTASQAAESDFLDTIEVDEGPKSALDLATGLNVDYKKFLAHSPKNYILINDTNGDKTCYSLDDIIHQSLDTNRIPEVYYECDYERIMRPQIERGQNAPLGFGPGDYNNSVEYVKIDYINAFIVKPNWNEVPAEPRMFKLVSTTNKKYLLSRSIAKGGANVVGGVHCDKHDDKNISILVPITPAEKASYDAAYAAAAGGKRKIKKYKKLSKTNKKTKKRVIKKMRKNRKKTRKNNKKN